MEAAARLLVIESAVLLREQGSRVQRERRPVGACVQYTGLQVSMERD